MSNNRRRVIERTLRRWAAWCDVQAKGLRFANVCCTVLGMRKPAVPQDPAAWKVGYKAGLSGATAAPPPGVDALAFASGVIEGQAARSAKVTRLPVSHKPQP